MKSGKRWKKSWKDPREVQNAVLLMIAQMMSCFDMKIILTHEFIGSKCCFRIQLHCFAFSSTPFQMWVPRFFSSTFCGTRFFCFCFCFLCFSFEKHHLDFPCDVFQCNHWDFLCDVFLCHHLDSSVILNVAICQYFCSDTYVYLLIYLQLSHQKYLHIVRRYLPWYLHVGIW